MKLKILIIIAILPFTVPLKTEFVQIKKPLSDLAIRETLMDYIEGTAHGQPDRLMKAFHEDMNLYSISNDTLKVLSGKTYTSYYKPGQKRDRIGKIISIDHVNDAAMAKLEIDYPYRRILYTDYILLLRIKGQWKIIQKSYTSVKY